MSAGTRRDQLTFATDRLTISEGSARACSRTRHGGALVETNAADTHTPRSHGSFGGPTNDNPMAVSCHSGDIAAIPGRDSPGMSASRTELSAAAIGLRPFRAFSRGDAARGRHASRTRASCVQPVLLHDAAAASCRSGACRTTWSLGAQAVVGRRSPTASLNATSAVAVNRCAGSTRFNRGYLLQPQQLRTVPAQQEIVVSPGSRIRSMRSNQPGCKPAPGSSSSDRCRTFPD